MTQTLSSLISPTSGWSNLSATAINDEGQIVGQGLINGQEQAFLMTPMAETPELGTLTAWCVGAIFGSLRVVLHPGHCPRARTLS